MLCGYLLSQLSQLSRGAYPHSLASRLCLVGDRVDFVIPARAVRSAALNADQPVHFAEQTNRRIEIGGLVLLDREARGARQLPDVHDRGPVLEQPPSDLSG